ncbi:MAG TPA: histidine kinase [Cyanobacteria bacterium UBA11149]|nr:histidine kinase [Cyanobacteria bacterium UBA11367]HBE60512.1 histidine kinase [Cyanobacteria bacterium UBA11366]HBK62532.1 histidine kinase [Cyanobacteria bacterium UBA11166]HBR75070.1 histidine kinase [Cyanobacteria bacterium UBA11159]HBS71271.1 histidine kinase [Cyanobacteria bacterium UBA11153]HBW89781.1 histidine kinase [Cyanobacteria bacterium UBA11149]HCA96071.1 histidine kinase [Cyanobacteria bacterium UBA9226]
METLYSISDGIKEQDLQKLIKSALSHHSIIQAMAWLPHITDEERRHFEKNAQLNGYPNFQITEKTKDGKIVIAKKQAYYFPAYQVFSLSKTGKLSGLNFAHTYESVLQTAIERNEIVATGSTQIDEIPKDGQFFFVFIPVYSKISPNVEKGEILNSTSLQQKKIKGFVLGIFQIDAIMKYALQDLDLENINLEIQDLMASEYEKFLAFYDAQNKKVITDQNIKNTSQLGQTAYCPDGSACTRIINIENRRWLLKLLPRPEYMKSQKYWRSSVILITGILLSSLITLYLVSLLRYTEQIEKIVGERTYQAQQLKKALQKLKQTQSQLVQTEKMSSLGLLIAGIAHEINNPINFISGNIPQAIESIQELLYLVNLYQKYYPNSHPEILDYIEEINLDFLIEDIPKLLSSMEVGANRITHLVVSLRNFSRLDESDMKYVDIHEGIESTLLILQNRLKAKPNSPAIEVVKNYGNLPLVECLAGQINQVLMNIITNAIDALDTYNSNREYQELLANSNQITITTKYLETNSIAIEIADNGEGMNDRVKEHLFDPFFTTKPVGKGTGLGLSISYQIVVEKHKGVLRCESVEKKGTTFWIEIPVRQNVQNERGNIPSQNSKIASLSQERIFT